MYDVPGYCTYTGTVNVPLDGSGEGTEIEIDADGKFDLPEGTTIEGVNPTDGSPITLTVQADGTVLPANVDAIRWIDPETGDSVLVRVVGGVIKA
jgi:hypothetical protein